jgi:hypothetical protein
VPGRPPNGHAAFDEAFHLLLARKEGDPPAVPEPLQYACLQVKALLGTPVSFSFNASGAYVAVPTASGLPPFESGGVTAVEASALAADLALIHRFPAVVEMMCRVLP